MQQALVLIEKLWGLQGTRLFFTPSSICPFIFAHFCPFPCSLGSADKARATLEVGGWLDKTVLEAFSNCDSVSAGFESFICYMCPCSCSSQVSCKDMLTSVVFSMQQSLSDVCLCLITNILSNLLWVPSANRKPLSQERFLKLPVVMGKSLWYP